MSDGREVAREPVVVRMILMSAPLWPCVCVCVCVYVPLIWVLLCPVKAGQVCVFLWRERFVFAEGV